LHRVLTRSAPAVLLIAVALLQIYLAHVRQILTPAKGGGFGLFSTVDKLETRNLRAYLVGDTWERPVKLDGLWGVMPRALSLPTDAALRDVAKVLLARAPGRPIVAARVEVWTREFDVRSGEARRVKLRELTLRRDDAGAD
jgi:hypothetical protein